LISVAAKIEGLSAREAAITSFTSMPSRCADSRPQMCRAVPSISRELDSQLSVIDSPEKLFLGRPNRKQSVESVESASGVILEMTQPEVLGARSEYTHNGTSDSDIHPNRRSASKTAANKERREIMEKSYSEAYKRTKEDRRDLGAVLAFVGAHAKNKYGNQERRFSWPRIEAFINSDLFGIVSSVVLLLNAIYVAQVETYDTIRMYQRYEAQVDRSEFAASRWYLIFDWCFVSYFFIEVVMRLLVDELQYFFGHDWGWNLVDFVVLILYIIEVTVATLGGDLQHICWSLLIGFRSVRIVRALRVMQELRRMLVAIVHSLKPFFWVFLFLSICIFIFAVPIQQAVSRLYSNALADDPVVEKIKPWFGTVPETVVSLFMAITGGADWGEMMYALGDISIVYALFFVFYIAVMVFGICNVITGIFVEAAQSMAKKDRDLIAQAENEKTTEGINQLRALFHEIDSKRTGTIAFEEFVECVRKEEVRAVFAQLDISNPSQIFRLLDVDESGGLEIDEFVMGCMNLKGGASKSDIEFLVRENQSLIRRLKKFSRVTKDNMTRLEKVTEHIGAMVKSEQMRNFE